ncbi:MAG TPA: acetone carboxylase [Marmoricola sp.]|nr:acetone carboxylase [Marmoricola sp.]
MSDAGAAAPDVCSARGCRTAAAHELRWNNPRIHTPDRRKVWLACDEHRQSLADFLAARGFLREVAPH